MKLSFRAARMLLAESHTHALRVSSFEAAGVNRQFKSEIAAPI
jgi:hypothetical protein